MSLNNKNNTNEQLHSSNQYSKPVCNLNTSQFYGNKEQWNNKQFERNSENNNIFQQNFISFQNALNISFSDNYRTQRKEAHDMFEKRRLDNFNSNNNLNQFGNANIGFVDFQDPRYKQYLMNKEVKK